MADDTAAPAAAPAAPAATAEDNPLAVETLAQLQALLTKTFTYAIMINY